MNSALHPRLKLLESQLSVPTLTPIFDDKLTAQRLELWIKRDDLLHPVISGNKWRKLKFILNHALYSGADSIVSMGGAYSNHLHALAFAGKCLGLKTIAYVRGEQPQKFNPTLIDLQNWGMELRFVTRSDYRQLRAFKHHDSLPDLKPGQYWLAEGGASNLALQGVAEILAEIERPFDVLVTACGTGTTLAGLIAAAPAHLQVVGIAALKNAGYLSDEVNRLLPNNSSLAGWQILLNYHFGGFAKTTPALEQFIRYFSAEHGVPLEPIYTGKMLFAVFDLLNKGFFMPGQRIVVLHTGGLQGVRH
ncbi:1-aminocyclopropane-1-carboxylate deaminase/D-cysteine desulfhydrase [Methylomonas sp. LL1]|uniref:1-aminocyclopropane-1-carboxylate deaminase/D-cysteine desulfhydrase n=1 Tax=Methylomonas sp. LL1 TaxID=2785785 RepID=UPI001E29FAF7|nr:pyridoxal-phosphate dependent enzyme [Methylomonas sp. LL1]